MGLPDFQDYPLWLDGIVFLAAGVIVWYGGTRLTRYVDGIALTTGIGHAFVGMLLLGGITSLPEVATAGTASWSGNAPLAVNNLLGSVMINVVLLAVADAMIGRDALTSTVGRPATLLQGTLSILMLTVVVMAVISGDVLVPGTGIGAWSTALVPLFLFSLWLSSKYRRRRPWIPGDAGPDGGRSLSAAAGEEGGEGEDRDEGTGGGTGGPLRPLIVKTVLAGLAILAAGYVLARTGDAIADKTGVGSSLVGLVLVGFATSLPEISSITAAVRLRRYEMAIGDIFGTNMFDVVLLFLADAAYSGEPVLNLAGSFEAVALLVGIVLSLVYLIGLLERRDGTVLRMGYDSAAVILVYLAGLGVLYFLVGTDAGGSGSL